MLNKNPVIRDNDMEPLENPGQVTGFSSPAEDYKQERLHVIQKLVIDPTNTFYFEADNNDLNGYGINRGAIIIVDRSIKVGDGKIVVANHENEWIIRKLIKNTDKMYLVTSVEDSVNIEVSDQTIFFGVVTWCCNPLLKN